MGKFLLTETHIKNIVFRAAVIYPFPVKYPGKTTFVLGFNNQLILIIFTDLDKEGSVNGFNYHVRKFLIIQ
jgi:hypothetical protein